MSSSYHSALLLLASLRHFWKLKSSYRVTVSDMLEGKAERQTVGFVHLFSCSHMQLQHLKQSDVQYFDHWGSTLNHVGYILPRI